MKKIVFTLMTVFALALMANSVMAQNEKNVLGGGTYTYNLSGVLSANDATATVSYDGGGETITQVGTSWDITGGTTSIVSFTIEYGTQASPAGDGDISVVITDDVSGCTNEILLTIDVSVPIYTLSIAKDETGYLACQTRTGAGDNTPDALGDDSGTEVNTFTFTVTPVITGVTGNFNYSYTIDFPDGSALDSYSIVDSDNNAVTDGVISYTDVSAVQEDVYTVTFNTTTGAATQSLLSQISVGAASVLTAVNDGGGVYNSTMTSGGSLSQTVTVNAVPTIGGFN